MMETRGGEGMISRAEKERLKVLQHILSVISSYLSLFIRLAIVSGAERQLTQSAMA